MAIRSQHSTVYGSFTAFILWATLAGLASCGGGGGNAGPGSVSVGGTVSGLVSGQAVTLSDNGTDMLVVKSNGVFEFNTAVASSTAYSVSIATQPDVQLCTIIHGSGTASAQSVTSITVTCAGPFSLGGTVSGLAPGSSVDLANGSVDSVTVTSDGVFTFPSPQKPGSTYSLSIGSQANTERCVISNSSGTLSSANVTDVSVVCNPPMLKLLAGGLGGVGSQDGQGASARFSDPLGLVTDPDGNLYVADSVNLWLRKVTPDGEVSRVFLLPPIPPGPNHENTGTTLTRDPAGNFYLPAGHAIYKVSPEGTATVIAGDPYIPGSDDGIGTAARFRIPTGVALDSAGNLFVSDTGNHVLRKVTPDGVVTTFAGQIGVSAKADGTAATASFSAPGILAMDASDTLYVTDLTSVRAITSAGVVTTVAGSATSGFADGTAGAAAFGSLGGIVIASPGVLYVADGGNHTIRKVTTSGVVTTIAGSPTRVGVVPGVLPASLHNPHALAMVGNTLYIVDPAENCVLAIPEVP
jgi:serine/threonine protein kinase, bacterial